MLLMLGFLGGSAALIQQCTTNSKKINEQITPNSYVGDEACKSCHASQYNDWLSSDHFKAMQVATGFGKGLKLSPLDGDLNYALCFLYVQSNQLNKAKQYALVLKKYYSGNREYEEIVQRLGL